jgi:hypothetical protein
MTTASNPTETEKNASCLPATSRSNPPKSTLADKTVGRGDWIIDECTLTPRMRVRILAAIGTKHEEWTQDQCSFYLNDGNLVRIPQRAIYSVADFFIELIGAPDCDPDWTYGNWFTEWVFEYCEHFSSFIPASVRNRYDSDSDEFDDYREQCASSGQDEILSWVGRFTIREVVTLYRYLQASGDEEALQWEFEFLD